MLSRIVGLRMVLSRQYLKTLNRNKALFTEYNFPLKIPTSILPIRMNLDNACSKIGQRFKDPMLWLLASQLNRATPVQLLRPALRNATLGRFDRDKRPIRAEST